VEKEAQHIEREKFERKEEGLVNFLKNFTILYISGITMPFSVTSVVQV